MDKFEAFLEIVAAKYQTEKTSIDEDHSSLRADIHKANATVASLTVSLSKAKQELGRMEKELESIEARAMAGLIAKETIARVAQVERES